MSFIDAIVKKAKKTVTTDYGKNFPSCQGVWLDKPGEIITIYPYGSAGNAPINSYMLMFNPGDQEEERIALEFHRESLPDDLAEDEYICGNFVAESTIKFDKDGNIIITGPAELQATIETNVSWTTGGNETKSITGGETKTVIGDISETAANTTEISVTLHTITAPNINLNGIVTISGALSTTGGASASFDGEFGCNGETAQAKATLGAAATNLTTVIALANNIRSALIANGIGET